MRLDQIAPHTIVREGISHVPEGRQVFANLTVRENLQLGAYLHTDRAEIRATLRARASTLFPVLAERAAQSAATLSGGEQQMLAIGRALMARPQLLLLDEPSLGLAPLVVQTIFSIIREINAQGTTILLVEQNAHMALRLAHRGYVMQTGPDRARGQRRRAARQPRGARRVPGRVGAARCGRPRSNEKLKNWSTGNRKPVNAVPPSNALIISGLRFPVSC